jgi:hypothetical protein
MVAFTLMIQPLYVIFQTDDRPSSDDCPSAAELPEAFPLLPGAESETTRQSDSSRHPTRVLNGDGANVPESGGRASIPGVKPEKVRASIPHCFAMKPTKVLLFGPKVQYLPIGYDEN